jgi:hypothetical protein
MPSRAETRARIEAVLRGASLLLLAWMLWLSLDRERPDTVVSARSANLGAALRDWSVSGIAPDRIAVSLDRTPSPRERAWLSALARTGSSVSWSGDLAPVAVATQSVASPRGGILVRAAGANKSRLSIFDEVGAIDTVDASGGGAAFAVPTASGFVSARAGGSVARTGLPDSVRIRRVLVLGNAGWEAKFVVAALEEDGWSVDASMYVAPGVSVTQGDTAPIDTARYSLVIALDASSASRASEINRYVASGGGLILAGNSASLDAFAQLRPALPGRIDAPATLANENEPTTLRSLGAVPAASLRPGAVALERRGATTVLAARRHVAGRVLHQGYLETWRWRMSGGDESASDHRTWWTRAASSVAYAPVVRSAPSVESDDAPMASLVADLGPPSTLGGASLASTAAAVPIWWLFIALATCLLGEWASRRLRGVP